MRVIYDMVQKCKITNKFKIIKYGFGNGFELLSASIVFYSHVKNHIDF